MNISEIAAIVLAARVLGAPTEKQVDGSSVRRLSLRGQRRGQSVDFTLHQGHRLWRLDSVTDDHGTDLKLRTLGNRLSARLDDLYAQAATHLADRPTPQ